jgi:hypothetical protein
LKNKIKGLITLGGILYKITYANKTFIKEYNRNESFLELYYLNSGGVSIAPVYESKINQ